MVGNGENFGGQVDSSKQEVDERSLYIQARETIAATPEDEKIFDQMYAETLDHLTVKYGEKTALNMMISFLEDTLAEAKGKQALFDHKIMVKAKTEKINNQYKGTW